jgi:ParB family chromosome partitioning protein
MLGLLKLHQDIQILVEHQELSMGHARALSKLSEKDALRLAKKVIYQALSVRQLEALIQQLKEKPVTVSKTETKHLKDIEDKYQLKAVYQEGKITLSGDDLKIQMVIDILNKHKG